MTDTPDVIDVIEENEEVFRTIAEEADDPEVADRFGRQPLQLLERHREREGDRRDGAGPGGWSR